MTEKDYKNEGDTKASNYAKLSELFIQGIKHGNSNSRPEYLYPRNNNEITEMLNYLTSKKNFKYKSIETGLKDSCVMKPEDYDFMNLLIEKMNSNNLVDRIVIKIIPTDGKYSHIKNDYLKTESNILRMVIEVDFKYI